jgi:hypothetical protein
VVLRRPGTGGGVASTRHGWWCCVDQARPEGRNALRTAGVTRGAGAQGPDLTSPMEVIVDEVFTVTQSLGDRENLHRNCDRENRGAPMRPMPPIPDHSRTALRLPVSPMSRLLKGGLSWGAGAQGPGLASGRAAIPGGGRRRSMRGAFECKVNLLSCHGVLLNAK